MTTDLVALDIGGTHARFAKATIGNDGAIALDEPITLRTSDYASLNTAWEDFARRSAQPVPRNAAIAIAGPVTGETVRMTNNSWVLHPSRLDDQLGLDEVTLINDFGAVAHAAARADASDFLHLAGPDRPLPETGTISVIGPGTGLGVAQFHRFADGTYHVQATEGGHIDFAPLDGIDDAILARLRARHRRVSVERVVSGPGIVDIHAALAALEGRPVPDLADKAIWQAGLEGGDALAVAAIDRFCLALGSVAGDLALAHGARAVVIAGGLGYRIRDTLVASGFAGRFRFKGRYEQMMAAMPVKLITHPQPGLFGAAAAFAREHLT
ncbi:glucokinase [Novosphingobium album (ex Liu et al. 2023)]|uniref:Glucokinase n=1 Tax=Novosphingobium album (ex Liu et al. 2023) TaxID=3031130 RepID=A0ABT5WLI9_9SPHN|nr:glucokinase [Novosphingobium album (ex Liu et al. 2023)]MDE8650172.1 glucokinase [Novosphingobium album (ex Liu et al. 2023)]